jgi:hypothetical protein
MTIGQATTHHWNDATVSSRFFSSRGFLPPAFVSTETKSLKQQAIHSNGQTHHFFLSLSLLFQVTY